MFQDEKRCVHCTLFFCAVAIHGRINEVLGMAYKLLKIVKQAYHWVYRLTSLGHQHWVCTSLGRSAPLPCSSYQD